jgi:hypothetical protein
VMGNAAHGATCNRDPRGQIPSQASFYFENGPADVDEDLVAICKCDEVFVLFGRRRMGSAGEIRTGRDVGKVERFGRFRHRRE